MADEPTTALDVVSQANVLQLLAEQRRIHQTAMLLITHDLRLAAHVCDDIAVFYAGEQVEYGPAREVLRRSRHHYTWALDHATPDVHGPQRLLPTLGGQMPGVAALGAITGCRFAARCPQQPAACTQQPPALVEHTSRALGALHRPREVGASHPDGGRPTPATGTRWKAPSGRPRCAAPGGTAGRDAALHRAPGLLGRRKVHNVAVNGLSLKVQPGEFVGIVGRKRQRQEFGGAPDRRRRAAHQRPAAVEGQEQSAPAPAAHARTRADDLPGPALRAESAPLGVPAADAGLRVRPNGGEARRIPREQRARQLLNDVGLPEDALTRFPSQLSGGQKQRVNIGRALCVMPKLVVADEIVSGLDVSVQARS